MDLLLYSTLSFVLFLGFFSSIFLLALASWEEGCQRACCIFQEVSLSLAFPISPFYSSGLFPFSCDAQPSFKHPISLVLLLLLSLGLHLLYRGFIPPLWLCFLLPFLEYFCLSLFFFFPSFSRFSFFFLTLSSPVLGNLIFHSLVHSLYFSGLPSSLAMAAPCLSALSFSPFCPLLGVSTSNRNKLKFLARPEVLSSVMGKQDPTNEQRSSSV